MSAQPLVNLNQFDKAISISGPCDPLMKLFTDHNIEIRGTVHDPVFNARDVANKFGDSHNYMRKLKTFSDKDVLIHIAKDRSFHDVKTIFLTERGLYKYLMQSKSEKAEEFQSWVFDKLKEIRVQVVDELQLQLKINADKVREIDDHFDSNCRGQVFLLEAEIKYHPKTCSDDVAAYYIARYFADITATISPRTKYHRGLVPKKVIDTIHRIVHLSFYEHNWYIVRDVIYDILHVYNPFVKNANMEEADKLLAEYLKQYYSDCKANDPRRARQRYDPPPSFDL